MIKGKMRVNNPDEVMVTLELTMPLKTWTEINRQLGHAWPSWTLSAVISQALGDINRIHYAEQEYQAP